MLGIPRFLRSTSTAFSIAAALLFSGCASILNKGDHSVTLYSDPAGATVHVNGNQKGTTPFTLIIPLRMARK